MLDSAVKILGPVPAANMDPQLLVQSQTSDASGYVMISYPLEADNLIYDLMLFKSNQVFGSFRLTPDLRFVVDSPSILQKFRVHKTDAAVRVSLYLAPIELLNKLRDTFHFAPSLKLKPTGLISKQIIQAAKAAQVWNGYLEINDFGDPADPHVTILDVNRTNKPISRVLQRFTTAQLKSSNCLLLYDIDKNCNSLATRAAELITPPFQVGDGGASSADSLDSILESILGAMDPRGDPYHTPSPSPAGEDKLPIESSSESTDEQQSMPAVKTASLQFVALFAELRSALIALLGRARAARSLNRALTSSSPREASKLRLDIEAGLSSDLPTIDTEENAQALIRCCIEIPNHLILSKRKAREKLARILADRYSRDYTIFTPDELEFLESLWKKLTK
ncbi:MAG TPA: hypothetical protein PL001_08685 [Candidatus Kryptobacter bacterium]|nr:hypothetical protein [Candidatus Kryptobacter bacterium]